LIDERAPSRRRSSFKSFAAVVGAAFLLAS
jgi:hypothetical protein